MPSKRPRRMLMRMTKRRMGIELTTLAIRKSEAGIDSQLEQKDIRPMSHVNGRACRLRSM